MCKYQSIKENNIPLCEVTGGLCDFCVFGDNRHFAEGEKKNGVYHASNASERGNNDVNKEER